MESGADVNAKFEPEVSQQHAEMTPLALAAAMNKLTTIKVCFHSNLFIVQSRTHKGIRKH